MSNPQTKDSKEKKVRVFNLAKDLNVESKLLLDFCKELGFSDIKNQLNGLEPEQVDALKERLKKGPAKSGSAPLSPPGTAPKSIIPPPAKLDKPIQTLPKPAPKPIPKPVEPVPVVAPPAPSVAAQSAPAPQPPAPAPEPAPTPSVTAAVPPEPAARPAPPVVAVAPAPPAPQSAPPGGAPAVRPGERPAAEHHPVARWRWDTEPERRTSGCAHRAPGCGASSAARGGAPDCPGAGSTGAGSTGSCGAGSRGAGSCSRGAGPCGAAPAAPSPAPRPTPRPTVTPAAPPAAATPTKPAPSVQNAAPPAPPPAPPGPPKNIIPSITGAGRPDILKRAPQVPPPNIIAGRRTGTGAPPPSSQRPPSGVSGPRVRARAVLAVALRAVRPERGNGPAAARLVRRRAVHPVAAVAAHRPSPRPGSR
ncbi:hypothetical protein FTUN_2898 [Frigoriglobus tundricola]|uniref:Uncharacterized protein n=1 Tax=Frigoriglobus tundricola TaxID=2774151 RepID=A0A6M5YPK8_9BACT|nr:hypothetical protein FTUN_2898 [Frigoriglobus tundricola]